MPFRCWSKGTTAFLVSVLVLAACSSTSSPSPPQESDAPLPVLERSGARLQARGYESEGLFVFDGFFDTKLGAMCDRGKASDGSDRCVPRVDPCAASTAHAPAELVAFTGTSEVPLATGISAVVANGEDGSRVGTGELVDQGQHCTITPAACGVPSSSTCSTPLDDGKTTHGALEEQTKTTTDGAAVSRSAIVDPSVGGRCQFAKTLDGSIRCVPIDVATVADNVFADAQCTRLVFQLPACDVKFGRVDVAQACGTLPQYFAVGPLGDHVYTRTSEGCVVTSTRPGLAAVGIELPPGRMTLGNPAIR